MEKRKATKQPKQEDATITVAPSYEAFVLAIVLLSILNSCLWFVMREPEPRQVVIDVQVLLCVFLMIDALFSLSRAHNKGHFLFHMWGALYFVGSLPVPFIFLLRLIPFWLMMRWLRRKEYEAMGKDIVRRYAESTLLVVVLAAILVLEFGSILVLHAEGPAADHNIKSAGDALWWSIVTIATVGYGDRFPITAWGRVIGVFMIVVGVGLFTALTSFMAQWFVRQRSNQAATPTAEAAPSSAPAPSDGAGITWEQILALIQAHEEDQRRVIADLQHQLAELQTDSINGSGSHDIKH
jgi:voltage-gated potassium channel Kch